MSKKKISKSRELAIVQFIAKGVTIREIANRTGLSTRTIFRIKKRHLNELGGRIQKTFRTEEIEERLRKLEGRIKVVEDSATTIGLSLSSLSEKTTEDIDVSRHAVINVMDNNIQETNDILGRIYARLDGFEEIVDKLKKQTIAQSRLKGDIIKRVGAIESTTVSMKAKLDMIPVLRRQRPSDVS